MKFNNYFSSYLKRINVLQNLENEMSIYQNSISFSGKKKYQSLLKKYHSISNTIQKMELSFTPKEIEMYEFYFMVPFEIN